MTERINIPTYDADLIFMFDVKRDRVKKYVKKTWGFELEGLNNDYSAITVDMEDLTWLIYVPDTERQDMIWLTKTLSHEANHVTLQLMRKVGVEDDEAICYCQDNLLGEMLYSVLKRKKLESKQKKERKKKKAES